MSIRLKGHVPYRIVLELETVETLSHAQARRAADRVGAAIEQLRSDRPGLAELPLVEIRRLKVERLPDKLGCEDDPHRRERLARRSFEEPPRS